MRPNTPVFLSHSKRNVMFVLCKITLQKAQLPQRNSASAAHVYLGWLTDRAVQVIYETYED